VALSTILVVDDDPGTRSLLRLIFETAGHEVLEAPHGKAALELIRPNSVPDVVVTDLMMPVLSGAELIEQLRSEQRTAAIPVVVVSASSDAARTLEASGLVQAVVRKPFDVYALVGGIEKVANPPDDTCPDLSQLAV
jgi:CheY-like chemotaxis protein